MRFNGLNLHQEGFRYTVRKNFFMTRIMKCWSRLPRKLVDSPSQKIFKRCVDMVLRDIA